MKILKVVMLTLLIILCATIAVVVVMQIFNGDESENAQMQRSRADRAVSDEAEDSSFVSNDTFYDDGTIWQRAMNKPDGSDYWHYYPIISRDYQPGDTVVLGATATGFQGWDVDSDFADVELFDETFTDGNVYISFVMPYEEVSIAALYKEIPFENFAPEFESFSNYISPEHGQAITPASAVTQIMMPPATVGIRYDVNLAPLLSAEDRAILANVRGDVSWVLREDTTLGDSILPTELNFEAVDGSWGNPSEAWIRGTPLNSQAVVYYTLLVVSTSEAPEWTDDTQVPPITHPAWPAGSTIMLRTFGLEVWPAADPPDFFLTTMASALPAGMVNVPYEVSFEAINLPADTTWVWSTTGILPPGLSLHGDINDMSRAVFRGIPTTSSTTDYTFRIILSTPNPNYPDVQKTFPIRIWDQPVISPDVPTQLAGGPVPPNLFDGIANANKRYNVKLEVDGVVLGPSGADTGWTWDIVNGTLPPGLTITTPPPLNGREIVIAGDPSLAGEYSFTAKYTADDRNILIGSVERDFTIRIVPRPEFMTSPTGLPDGMDWRPRYGTDEPEDAPYVATIEADGFPEADKPVAWTWDVASGALPPGDSAPQRNMRLQRIDEGFHIITGMPQTDVPNVSQDYNFTIEISATSDNPNINGAVISESFRIRIWARRYLHVEFVDTRRTDGFVRRATTTAIDPIDPGETREVVDVNWNSEAWAGSLEADKYRLRRAVMPGNDGEIRVPLGNTGFVRWEVIENPVIDPNADSPVTRPNSNRFAQIGGPDRYSTGTSHAFVLIEMPSFVPGTANGARTNADGDIYIRAVDPLRAPIWTERLNNGSNIVDDPDASATIIFGAADVGAGGRPTRWEHVSGSGELPAGMSLVDANITALIIGAPKFEGSFTFTLGFHLPGSMRVDREFTMIIEPVPGILYGDVNGDGQRNLADLVMLARFIRGEITTMPNLEAGNIISAAGTRPNLSDLDVLARYFARPDSSLSAAPPPPPSPDPEP